MPPLQYRVGAEREHDVDRITADLLEAADPLAVVGLEANDGDAVPRSISLHRPRQAALQWREGLRVLRLRHLGENGPVGPGQHDLLPRLMEEVGVIAGEVQGIRGALDDAVDRKSTRM